MAARQEKLRAGRIERERERQARAEQARLEKERQSQERLLRREERASQDPQAQVREAADFLQS